MVIIFKDDHGYRSWLDANPNGFVLNVRSKPSPRYAVLHVADCKSINGLNHAPGAYTERSYRKVCGTTVSELSAWLIRECGVGSGFSKECSCMARNR